MHEKNQLFRIYLVNKIHLLRLMRKSHFLRLAKDYTNFKTNVLNFAIKFDHHTSTTSSPSIRIPNLQSY